MMTGGLYVAGDTTLSGSTLISGDLMVTSGLTISSVGLKVCVCDGLTDCRKSLP